MKTYYYTNCKNNDLDQNIKLKVDDRPYYLKGAVLEENKLKGYTNYAIGAVDAQTNKLLGACSFSISKSKHCQLLSIENEHKYFNHCGIGTKLLQSFENFALSQGVNEVIGFIDTTGEFYCKTTDFFVKNGYVLHGDYTVFNPKLTHHDGISPVKMTAKADEDTDNDSSTAEKVLTR